MNDIKKCLFFLSRMAAGVLNPFQWSIGEYHSFAHLTASILGELWLRSIRQDEMCKRLIKPTSPTVERNYNYLDMNAEAHCGVAYMECHTNRLSKIRTTTSFICLLGDGI